MAPLFRAVVNGLSMNCSSRKGVLTPAAMDSNAMNKKDNNAMENASSSSSSSISGNARSFRDLSSKRHSISSYHSGFSSSTDSNDSSTGDLSADSTATSVSSAAPTTTNHTRFIDRYPLMDSKLLQSVISVCQQQQQHQLASTSNRNKRSYFIFPLNSTVNGLSPFAPLPPVTKLKP